MECESNLGRRIRFCTLKYNNLKIALRKGRRGKIKHKKINNNNNNTISFTAE